MTILARYFFAATLVLRLAVPGLMILLGTTSWSAANALLIPATAAEARAAEGKGSKQGRLVRRSRVVRVDRNVLARHVAPLGMDSAPDRLRHAADLEGVVTLDLFPDVSATFQRSAIDTTGESGYSWTGEVRGDPLRFASLIVDEGRVTGHIQLLHRLFRIEPLDNDVHRVSELIPSRFPREYAIPRKPPSRSWTQPPARDNGAAEPRAVEKTIIHVLMVYTAAALAENPNIKNDIKLAITLANQAFNRGKTLIKFVRVRTISAQDYVEAGAGYDGFVEDLGNLGGDNDPDILDFVRRKRNRLKADLVAMVRTNDPSICGVANFTETPGPIYKDFAFSIVTSECIPNYSFHHEAGHNMSLRHDLYAEPEAGLVYNHGYVNTKAACRVRTVMGYNTKCSDAGYNCTRINYFSRGVKVNVDGTLCRIGIKKGSPNAADNAKRLKEVRLKVHNYRKMPTADLPPPVSIAAD